VCDALAGLSIALTFLKRAMQLTLISDGYLDLDSLMARPPQDCLVAHLRLDRDFPRRYDPEVAVGCLVGEEVCLPVIADSSSTPLVLERNCD
jgi:hypothetical protein